MKVVYIGASMFVKMHQFWILSFPPPLAYSYWVVFSLNIKVDQQSELLEYTRQILSLGEQPSCYKLDNSIWTGSSLEHHT